MMGPLQIPWAPLIGAAHLRKRTALGLARYARCAASGSRQYGSFPSRIAVRTRHTGCPRRCMHAGGAAVRGHIAVGLADPIDVVIAPHCTSVVIPGFGCLGRFDRLVGVVKRALCAIQPALPQQIFPTSLEIV